MLWTSAKMNSEDQACLLFANHIIRRAVDDGLLVVPNAEADKAFDRRLELAEQALLAAGYERVDPEGNWRKPDVVDAEFDPDFQEVGAAKVTNDIGDLLQKQAEGVYNLATRSCRAMADYLGKSREDVSFEVVQAIVLLETGRIK